MSDITELYCVLDEFCKEFGPEMHKRMLDDGIRKRRKATGLSLAELMPRACATLAAVFDCLKGECTGISFVDSTPLAVCDNLRIPRHKGCGICLFTN